MEKIDLLTQTVETDVYELPLKFFLKCESLASKLELTVDYVIAEFFIDGKFQMKDEVLFFDTTS